MVEPGCVEGHVGTRLDQLRVLLLAPVEVPLITHSQLVMSRLAPLWQMMVLFNIAPMPVGLLLGPVGHLRCRLLDGLAILEEPGDGLVAGARRHHVTLSSLGGSHE